MPDTNTESSRTTCGDCVDWENSWGRVTKLLEVPWGSSSGKVCEEIRKLINIRNDCKKLASTAGMECGASYDQLFDRVAEIQRVTER